METMLPVLGGLSMLLGVISLICWILEIVTAFNRGDGPLMGILSIVLCGLGGFIIGWIHHSKWGITKLMTGWTVVVVLTAVLQLALLGLGMSMGMNQVGPDGMPSLAPDMSIEINEPALPR